jgi:hypothetical protein
MSFSLEYRGQHAAVKAKIQSELYVPASLKQTICEVIGSGANSTGIYVKASGHTNSDGSGNIYELKVEPISLLLNPEPVAAPAAASS